MLCVFASLREISVCVVARGQSKPVLAKAQRPLGEIELFVFN